MPFSWFGGNTSSSASTSSADAEASGRHARKVSLSNSSGGKSARLAGVRAETRASYLRKDLNLSVSGDLSTSRSRRGRTTRSQAIVAVEPDSDFSEHRRIDQGLIDASMEAQNSVLQPPSASLQNTNNKSWWGGFSSPASSAATALPPATPPPTPQIPSKNIRLGISHSAHVPKSSGSSMSTSNLQHRRTVSNKFRVP